MDFIEHVARENERPRYRPVTALMPLNERFRNLRFNYREHAERVALGLDSWHRSDPYRLGDWVNLFTPIEMAAWQDIRAAGLPLWPQLPVARFFVDFGNPVAKIALECDGQRWHDPVKDAARDRELFDMGWRVYRAPGWRCWAVMERPDNYAELSADEKETYHRENMENTMDGLIAEMRSVFESKGLL